MMLPGDYKEWIKDFKYPDKNASIRTVDGRSFNVRIFPIGCDHFFFNGWLDMITSLKIPSKSWLVFQYEEVVRCFRIFYFYQDIPLAPTDYFYYKAGCSQDRENFMVVNRFFAHHKMMNTVPAYLVVIWTCAKGKCFVRMEEIDSELYITSGWNRIKKEMSITENHLVVFEMVDLHTFDMSLFSCDPPLLSYPPELCVVKEEPTYDVVEISDDEHANQMAHVNVQDNDAEGVPRLSKQWAKDNGLDRKVPSKIKDRLDNVWDVEIGIEFSQGCPRYNVTGMKQFVKDKRMGFGEVFQLLYVKSEVSDVSFGRHSVFGALNTCLKKVVLEIEWQGVVEYG